jgi:hypothetical protein
MEDIMKEHRSLYRPTLEILEARLLLDHGSAAEDAEHAYFQALLDPALASNVAVANGPWSQPSTWQNGAVPVAGAKVFIPQGISVLFNAGTTPSLAWIRDEGSLTFADTQDESLLVETITVLPTGSLDIGSAASAFQHHATITFADNGPVRDANGPLQMGRGLISHGHVGIYGQPIISFAPTAVTPAAGDRTLSISGQMDWHLGDTILLTGTSPDLPQVEQRTIVGISFSASATVVTLNQPLSYSHLAPAGLDPYVADEARTITFTSQNTTDNTRFGHLMFMHNPDVTINYAAIVHMGRTDKSRLIDDVVNYDQDNGEVPGGGTNVRGRYALHFHRTGTDPSLPPIKVVGNFLTDSPGWGYVNHSSNVAFTDNVSYAVVGAGFVTEKGDEIGSFTHNLAVYERGAPDIAFDRRERLADWGYEGDGFALASGTTRLVDNVSSGAVFAYRYIGIAIKEGGGIGDARVAAAALNDPSIADADGTLLASLAPIREFNGNEAFASDTGIGTYSYRPIVTNLGTNIIDNATIWNIGSIGINLDYTDDITIRDARILNDGSGYKTAIRTNNSAVNLTILNAHVEGFVFGLNPSEQGTTIVNGGFWHNATDLLIGNGQPDFGNSTVTRSIIVIGVTFGTEPQETWVSYRILPNTGLGLENYLSPQGSVTYNGQTLYAVNQAADYVAWPTLQSRTAGVPGDFVGKTNQQLLDLFGVTAGGVIAPPDTVAASHVIGLLGS